MSDEAHELLGSDLMRMAELLERLHVNTLPTVEKIAESFITPGMRGNKSLLALSAEDINETLELARVIHERIRAATDPRVSLVKCVGVFRDDSGTMLYRAVVLCAEDEFDHGVHYDLVRAAAEDVGYDVATGDPVVDEVDDAFSGFSPFDWSSISPREWLVSSEVKSIFLLD